MTRNLPWIAACVALALAGIPTAATAEDSPAQDPFESLLYPPDLVMRNQASIGLSDDQRQVLIAEITRAQADLLPFQMEMAEFAEILARRLAKPRVDEEAALGAAIRIMDLEREIKRRHLRLAIRIKNLLTEEQQKRLDDLRP